MDAHSIALAFNTANDKKTWIARANSRPAGGTDMVHFNAQNGMVTLSYNAVDGKFTVKFNKLHGAWGDYVTAIARSLYVVLNTLKAAGLPFEAPPSPEGVEIIATKGAANVVYVRYVPPVDPVMPELRSDHVRDADIYAGFDPALHTTGERVVGVHPALAAPYGERQDGTPKELDDLT